MGLMTRKWFNPNYPCGTKADLIEFLTDNEYAVCYASTLVGDRLWAVMERTSCGDGLEYLTHHIYICMCDLRETLDGYWQFFTILEPDLTDQLDCPVDYLDMTTDPNTNETWRTAVRSQ